MSLSSEYKAVVMGASAGGLQAFEIILSSLPQNFSAPIFIVQHISNHSTDWSGVIQFKSNMHCKEAEDKEPIQAGVVYIAPADYHLLVEANYTLQLSCDGKENYSRPSIDVLFESAAKVYRESLIGVILTGASPDGSKGLMKIKSFNGCALVQDPKTAEFDTMPRSAIEKASVDYILPLKDIGPCLIKLVARKKGRS